MHAYYGAGKVRQDREEPFVNSEGKIINKYYVMTGKGAHLLQRVSHNRSTNKREGVWGAAP